VTDLPVMIFAMRDIPLGLLVQGILDKFETDCEIRYRILAGVRPGGAYPRSREEVEKSFSQLKLNDFVSRVWIREMTANYLEYINLAVARIRGRRDRTVVALDEVVHEENLDNLRTAWLKASDLHKSLNALIEALEKAMSYFNIQMVAGWLGENLGMYRFHKLLKGLEAENAARQLSLVADFGYYRGRDVFQNHCARAFDRLKDTDAPEFLKELFIFTPGQLNQLAAVRMGYSLPSLEKFEPVAKGSEQAESTRGFWREGPGGLITPR